ncbi:MAG: glutamate--tRNA ligase, partial [Candidatus Limnocylindria bacterium]
LGITWDEGPQVAGGEDIGPYAPYRQSQRMETYASEARRLLESGAAYRCYCTTEELDAVRREQEARHEPPRYGGRCLNLTDAEREGFEAEGRRAAIRFRVQPEKIAFDDLVRGEVEFDNALLGDFVIVRGDGGPLYHFTVVVDDEAMEISHVIRGEEHLSNTPKHIALITALGYREPRFGHIPLILNPDRTKMSKRKSQTAVAAFREQGYLPEAMVNFLAFLGWSPGTEEEIFTLEELVQRFEIEKVHHAGAIFDQARLDHLNGVYIRALSDEQLALRVRPFVPDDLPDEGLMRMIPLIKERLVRLGDVTELIGFVWEPDEVVANLYAPELLVPKKGEPGDARRALERSRALISELDDADFSADVLEQRFREAADAEAMKAGDFFTPVRVAVTGRTVSPPLFASLELLGRERALARLDAALDRLGPGATA